jgi:hypothetical protein
MGVFNPGMWPRGVQAMATVGQWDSAEQYWQSLKGSSLFRLWAVVITTHDHELEAWQRCQVNLSSLLYHRDLQGCAQRNPRGGCCGR